MSYREKSNRERKKRKELDPLKIRQEKGNYAKGKNKRRKKRAK